MVKRRDTISRKALKPYGVGSRYNAPSRIVPQRGKVANDSDPSPNSEHWRVFHEDEARLYLANNSPHFAPESAFLAFDPSPFSGAGDVRAGKAARNDVNNSSPRAAVKGFHVRPNGERLKTSIVLSLRQNGRGVGITFNGADGAPSEQVPPEYAATSACEKSQLIHHPSLVAHSHTLSSHS
jgi:hypothetical protein